MFALLTLSLFAATDPVELTPKQIADLQTIAFQSARQGDVKTLREYFAAGRPVNEANPRGDTLLIVAAYNGQAEAVGVILAQPKVTVDARNGMGLTALAAAAFHGHTDIAKTLLKHKADVNATNASGQTALMFAALSGRTATVEALLAAKADASKRDKSGRTALSLAQQQGADEVVKLLTKHAEQRQE